MYFIGIYTLDLNKSERKNELDDFANSIIIELNTLQKVEPGFYRKIIIPDYIMKKYKVNITYNWLILTDLEYIIDDSNNSIKENSFYYQLPGDLDINYSYNNISNEVILVFKKKLIDYNNDLYLS